MPFTPPPQHLRANSEGLSLALAAYEKALARFDRQTLERGWDKIVAEQTFWCWPNPGEIADACRQCMPHPRPPSDEERRKQQAMDLADTYTTRYMKTSQVAKLARREGWSERLREYVYDAAWGTGPADCRWSTTLAGTRSLPREAGQFRSSYDAFEAYRQTIRRTVESGHVRVIVPRNRIREWKEQFAGQMHEEQGRAGGCEAR